MYQYQVSFGQAISRAFSKYCCFTGRASRSEYWWFYLFNQIISAALSIPVMGSSVALLTAAVSDDPTVSNGAAMAGVAGFSIWSILSYIWSLVILLPSMGLFWRRLHDTGRSGWNWLWFLLPIAGWIVILVFLCQASSPEENKYGPVPNTTNA